MVRPPSHPGIRDPHGVGAEGASSHDGVIELTWDIFGEVCRALALRVAGSGFDPELIVGIATAGVIPGAVIASILRRDFFSMKITRRTGGERVREEPQVLTAAPRQVAGRRVLVVDEICTTGATLRLATAAVRHAGAAELRTATSFVKPGGFHPDFYTLETDGAVVFPWDRKIVDDRGELIENPAYDALL